MIGQILKNKIKTFAARRKKCERRGIKGEVDWNKQEKESVCARGCVLHEGLCYFLALPPLAAFLGGVTGRPYPNAPAPLYANVFLSAGFKIWEKEAQKDRKCYIIGDKE